MDFGSWLLGQFYPKYLEMYEQYKQKNPDKVDEKGEIKDPITDFIKKSYFGEDDQAIPLPKYYPGQIEGLNKLLSGGLSSIQNPMAGFNDIKNEAIRHFQTETVPTLAHQFTTLGGDTKLGSSPFTKALGAAGSGLESSLAALGADYGLQNKRLGLQQAELGLRPAFDYYLKGGKPGLLQNTLQGLGSTAAKYAAYAALGL